MVFLILIILLMSLIHSILCNDDLLLQTSSNSYHPIPSGIISANNGSMLRGVTILDEDDVNNQINSHHPNPNQHHHHIISRRQKRETTFDYTSFHSDDERFRNSSQIHQMITQEEHVNRMNPLSSPKSEVMIRRETPDHHNFGTKDQDSMTVIRVKRTANSRRNITRNRISRQRTTRKPTSRNEDVDTGFEEADMPEEDDGDLEDVDRLDDEDDDDSSFDKELLLARSSIPMSPADAYRKKMRELAAASRNSVPAGGRRTSSSSSSALEHVTTPNPITRLHITIQAPPMTTSTTPAPPTTRHRHLFTFLP